MTKAGEKTYPEKGSVGEYINIRYHDELVAIFKDAKIDWRLEHFNKPLYEKLTVDGAKRVPGWTWGVFVGEGFTGAIGERAWETREEAEQDAREVIKKWIERDKKADEETAAHQRLLSRSFATEDDAKRAGASAPERYTCDECGASFYAEWRSNYSPRPKCPVCEGDDMTHTEAAIPRYNRVLRDGGLV